MLFYYIFFFFHQVHSHNPSAQTAPGPEDYADDSRRHLGGGHDTVHTEPDILHHVHGTISQRRATGHMLRRVAGRHHHGELPGIRVSTIDRCRQQLGRACGFRVPGQRRAQEFRTAWGRDVQLFFNTMLWSTRVMNLNVIIISKKCTIFVAQDIYWIKCIEKS